MLDLSYWPQGLFSIYLSCTMYLDCSGNDTSKYASQLSNILYYLGLTKRLKSSKSKRTNITKHMYATHPKIRTVLKL